MLKSEEERKENAYSIEIGIDHQKEGEMYAVSLS